MNFKFHTLNPRETKMQIANKSKNWTKKISRIEGGKNVILKYFIQSKIFLLWNNKFDRTLSGYIITKYFLQKNQIIKRIAYVKSLFWNSMYITVAYKP